MALGRKRGMKANTAQRIQSNLEVYDRWCRDLTIDPTERESFAYYLEYLVEEGHTDNSIKGVVAAVGRMIPEAVAEDDVTAALTAAAARKREANLRDLRKVLARMTSDSFEDIRDRTILLLGTLGDLTSGELANLDVDDILLDDDVVMLSIRDYSKERKPTQEKDIPNEMGLCEALQAWVDAAGITSGCVFRAFDSEGRPSDRGMNQSGIDHIRRYRCQNVNVDPMKVRGRPTRKSTRANFSTREVDDLFNMCEEYEFKATETQKKLDAALAHIRLLEEQTQAVRQFVSTNLPSWADAPSTTPLCD